MTMKNKGHELPSSLSAMSPTIIENKPAIVVAMALRVYAVSSWIAICRVFGWCVAWSMAALHNVLPYTAVKQYASRL